MTCHACCSTERRLGSAAALAAGSSSTTAVGAQPLPVQHRCPVRRRERRPDHAQIPEPWCCRDVLVLGDCDDGVGELCRLLGWEAELAALVEQTGFQPQDRLQGGKL